MASEVKAKESKKYGKFDEWEISDMVNTLIRAEEIKCDKEKMKYVGPMLDKKFKETKKTITSIKGLKDKYQELVESESEDED